MNYDITKKSIILFFLFFVFISGISVNSTFAETAKEEHEFQTVENFIDTWADAWAKKNFDEYIRCYADDFIPSEKISRDKWLEIRKKMLEKPDFIEIGIDITKKEILDPNTVLITFLQKYESNLYKDVSIKKMTLRFKDNTFKIIGEDSIEKSKSKTVKTIRKDAVEESKFETVENFIDTWADAWAKKNFDEYIRCYADDFIPSGKISRDKWLEIRKKMLEKPDFIEIIIDITKKKILNSDTILITFTQKYESNLYKDISTKKMTIRHEDNTFKIIREDTIIVK